MAWGLDNKEEEEAEKGVSWLHEVHIWQGGGGWEENDQLSRRILEVKGKKRDGSLWHSF